MPGLYISVSLDSNAFAFVLVSVFFFFWLGPVHCSQDPQVRKKCKSNFKTWFHDTIHTFKNYFAIVFSVFSFQFSTISSIQTDL